jgi:hypothetical protein
MFGYKLAFKSSKNILLIVTELWIYALKHEHLHKLYSESFSINIWYISFFYYQLLFFFKSKQRQMAGSSPLPSHTETPTSTPTFCHLSSIRSTIILRDYIIQGPGNVCRSVISTRLRVGFSMRSLDFSIDLTLPAMGSTQPLTEMSTRNLPGGKGRPARKTDNLTAICGPIV